MYEKISERSEGMFPFPLCAIKDADKPQYLKVLDQIIDDFAELIRGHYDIPEFADPSATTDVCPLNRFYMLTSEGQDRRKSM